MAKTSRVDRLNRWLTLGANIGVLLGLIVLIVEVRQNANLSRVAMEADKNTLLANIELSMAAPATAEAWAISVRAPEKLTDAQIRIVESHLVAVMLQWDQLFQMQSVDLASKERVVQHIRAVAPFYFGSAFAKNWWRYESRGWEGTQMFAVSSPIVEALDERFLEKRLDAIHVNASAEEEHQQASVDADRKALIALDDAWVTAEIGGDRQALERIFDEKFISTFKSGKTVSRDAYIDYIVNATITPFSVVHDTIEIHGDTAVVVDLSTNGKTKFTWIAVKRAGAWRVINQTFSTVAETP